MIRMPAPRGSSDLPNLILGGAPLLGDLTGIGYYTRHLAEALVEQQLLSDLKLWGDLGFLSDDVINRLPQLIPTAADSANKRRTLGRALRRIASKSYTASLLYHSISGQAAAWRLAPYRETHVFHSPNFILPRYEGRNVITIHDLSVIRFPQFHRKQMVEMCERGIRRAIEAQANIVVDSDLVRQELVTQLGVKQELITTVHLAADDNCRPRGELECRAVLARWGLQYQSFFLSVGTIEPRKNLLRVFEAFRAGRQQKAFDWPLVVVGGPGWKSQKEHEALRALCADGLAIYLSYVDDVTLHLLYSAAGALVFPSLYEGFGLPVAEALASGCPVMTSRGSAMEEFAGQRVVLVDPMDSTALRDGMVLVSEDAPAGNRLAPEPERSWRDVAVETARVYDMML